MLNRNITKFWEYVKQTFFWKNNRYSSYMKQQKILLLNSLYKLSYKQKLLLFFDKLTVTSSRFKNKHSKLNYLPQLNYEFTNFHIWKHVIITITSLKYSPTSLLGCDVMYCWWRLIKFQRNQSEDGHHTFLHNTGNHLDYMMSQPRRTQHFHQCQNLKTRMLYVKCMWKRP
jgi:hypothetical protein